MLLVAAPVNRLLPSFFLLEELGELLLARELGELVDHDELVLLVKVLW